MRTAPWQKSMISMRQEMQYFSINPPLPLSLFKPPALCYCYTLSPSPVTSKKNYAFRTHKTYMPCHAIPLLLSPLTNSHLTLHLLRRPLCLPTQLTRLPLRLARHLLRLPFRLSGHFFRRPGCRTSHFFGGAGGFFGVEADGGFYGGGGLFCYFRQNLSVGYLDVMGERSRWGRLIVDEGGMVIEKANGEWGGKEGMTYGLSQ